MKPLVKLIPITILLFFSGFIRVDKTDDYVIEKLKQYRIPGAAIVVIKDGKIIKKNNYGTYSIEFNLPVTDSSIFPLASVTKIFTSTVIMKLVEQGKLSLDQPVTDFLDSLPDSWQQIRIRHLLSHTSGIVNHFQTRKARTLSQDEQSKLSTETLIRLSASEPLRFTPGDQFSYNVTGYVLLGYIAEKATGKPIDQLAKELIFDPLKMNATVYGDYKAVIKNRNSLVYTYQNGPFETWNFTYGASGTTAAGLNSTTSDLAKFFIALDKGRVLSRPVMQLMMHPTQLNDNTVKDYGLGWAVDENKGHTCYGHEGGGCAWVDYYPDEHLTVVVLSNLTGSKADEIIKGIGQFYL
jgi:CubicO group peptidase (beta-lactamase class C family)